MNSVAVSRTERGNQLFYTIVTDKDIQVLNEDAITSHLRRDNKSIQNLGFVKDKNSYLSIQKVDFNSGRNYPEFTYFSKRNIEKFTLLGFTTNNRGMFYIISNYKGVLLVVSSLEIALLEAYDLITNATYGNGSVSLISGTIEEVSTPLVKSACFHSSDFIKKTLKEAFKSKHITNRSGKVYSISRLDRLKFIEVILGLGLLSFRLDSKMYDDRLIMANNVIRKILV